MFERVKENVRRVRERSLDQDFQSTFGTDAGRRVLLHLYKELGHEYNSTLPVDGNTTLGAFHEGRRSVWCLIARRLRESNEEIRHQWDESEKGRVRESQYE